jgi:hypothetical protein
MISITATINGFIVDFNGYFESGAVDIKQGYWSKQQISRIFNHGTYIEVKCIDGDWLVNTDGAEKLLGVSLVNGEAPVSVDDLYDKIVSTL